MPAECAGPALPPTATVALTFSERLDGGASMLPAGTKAPTRGDARAQLAGIRCQHGGDRTDPAGSASYLGRLSVVVRLSRIRRSSAAVVDVFAARVARRSDG